MAGAGTLANKEVAYDHEIHKEPNAPSSLAHDPVSLRSSSYWEAMTTLDITFLGMALAAREARDGVEVPGGTYSGSRSSSEPMTRRANGAIDFNRPCAYTRSYFGAIIDSTCKESLLVIEGENKTRKTTQNK